MEYYILQQYNLGTGDEPDVAMRTVVMQDEYITNLSLRTNNYQRMDLLINRLVF